MRLKIIFLVVVVAASGFLLSRSSPHDSGASSIVGAQPGSESRRRPDLSVPLHSTVPANERVAVMAAESDQPPREVLGPGFELRFLDGLGSVVSGVGVWQRGQLESTDEYSFCGQSTKVGVLRVEATEHVSQKVFRFIHADFSEREEVIDVAPGSGVTIELRQGAEIRGVALGTKGLSLGDRPWVLAHRVGRQPSKRQVFGKLQGEEEPVHMVRVDEDGAFSFTGLQESGRYILFVGGSGFATARHFGPISPGPEIVDIPVGRAYGAVIRLVDASTAMPLASPLQWRIGGLQYFWDQQGQFECLGWDSLQAVLLGVPIERLRVTPTSTSLALFVGQPNSAEADEIGPIKCLGQALGCESLEVHLSLPRMQDSLQTIDVDVQRLGGQSGELHIRWALPSDYLGRRPGVTDGEAAHIRLRELGADLTYTLPLTDQDVVEGGCTWPDVPYGAAYMAWFRFAGSTHYLGRSSGNVPFDLSSEVRVIEFDLSEVQTLELKLSKRDGGVFEGFALFEISRVTSEGVASDFVAFQRGPYRIDGFHRESYEVRVFEPFFSELGTVDLTEAGSSGSARQVEVRQP